MRVLLWLAGRSPEDLRYDWEIASQLSHLLYLSHCDPGRWPGWHAWVERNRPSLHHGRLVCELQDIQALRLVREELNFPVETVDSVPTQSPSSPVVMPMADASAPRAVRVVHQLLHWIHHNDTIQVVVQDHLRAGGAGGSAPNSGWVARLPNQTCRDEEELFRWLLGCVRNAGLPDHDRTTTYRRASLPPATNTQRPKHPFPWYLPIWWRDHITVVEVPEPSRDAVCWLFDPHNINRGRSGPEQHVHPVPPLQILRRVFPNLRPIIRPQAFQSAGQLDPFALVWVIMFITKRVHHRDTWYNALGFLCELRVTHGDDPRLRGLGAIPEFEHYKEQPADLIDAWFRHHVPHRTGAGARRNKRPRL